MQGLATDDLGLGVCPPESQKKGVEEVRGMVGVSGRSLKVAI